MRIALAGGTGLMGTLVGTEARARGHDVVVLARSHGVDLMTGAGVDDAVRGADVVIDVTNVGTLKADDSVDFFDAVTRTLLAAGQRADVPHHVALSIVGVDRAPVGYYAGKRAQEVAIENGPLEWSTLRATQFHEFAPQMYASARLGPLHIAPKMRTQPIAAREVAARLVDIAEGPARGGYLEIAGPREESLVDMMRRWAAATGRRGWMPAVALPGRFGKAQRDGSLLPTDTIEGSAGGLGTVDRGTVDRGTETFADWLRRTTG